MRGRCFVNCGRIGNIYSGEIRVANQLGEEEKDILLTIELFCVWASEYWWNKET